MMKSTNCYKICPLVRIGPKFHTTPGYWLQDSDLTKYADDTSILVTSISTV